MNRSKVLVAVAILIAGLCAAPEVTSAQGRLEDKTEAERIFIDGQRLEDEANSLKASDPEEAEELFEQAIERYRAALAAEPGMIDAYVRLGYVYYALERIDDATEVLAPAVRRWPNSVALKRVFGTVLFGQKGKRQEAVANLTTVAEQKKDEEYYDVLFLLGKHHYEAGDLKQAARMFRRYLKHQPEDIKIHGTLGNIYFRTNKYGPALAEFRYVLSLAPGNLPARINIANIYFKKKDYDKAIERYIKILDDHGGQQGVRFNLASSYYQSGDFRSALRTYANFAKARPKLPVGFYWMGLCYIKLDRPSKARQAFGRVIALDPRHARALWRVGLLDLEAGQVEQARATLEKAHGLDSDNAWILMALGDSLRELKQLDAAVARHVEAIKLAPDEPQAHLALGRDHFAAADLGQAVASFDRAYKLAPKDNVVVASYAVSLLHRGHARLEAGELDEARADAQLAYELKLRPLSSRLLLAAIAMESGDLDAARDQINAAAKIDDDHPRVRLAQGLLALQDGKGEAAIGHLEGLLEDGKTKDLAVANALARSYAAADRWADALQWFVAARSLGMDKEAANRNIALSSLYFGEQAGKSNKWRQALGAFETTANFKKLLTPVEQLRLDLDLGQAYVETNAFGKALRKLSIVNRKMRSLTKEEKKTFPSRGELDLDLRLAYVQYRIGKLDEAIRILERLPMRGASGRKAQQLLVSSYLRKSSALYRGGKTRKAEELLKKASRIAKGDELVKHNLAVIEYASGRGKRAGGVFKALANSGRIPASLYNHGIYLDDVKKDERGAFDAYRSYIKRGGPRKAEAQKLMDAKRRVFGFGKEGL